MCEACSANAGEYHLTRLCCCVRLVASARPSRKLQEGMLAAIGKFSGAPSREEIIKGLKNEAGVGSDD